MTSDFCIALHALVYLDHKACALSSEQLADNICTNPARVRKVMAKLAKAGMIETREGNAGGYVNKANPSKTTLADIADALDARFVEMSWLSGDTDKDCLVSSGMSGIMQDILDDLDSVCRKRLAQTTVADIGRKIFSRRNKT